MYIIDYLYIASWPAILSYLRNTYEENLAGHFRNVRAKPPFLRFTTFLLGTPFLKMKIARVPGSDANIFPQGLTLLYLISTNWLWL